MPKILIIDDDAAILELCHELLTQSNHTVVTAANLQQGLFLIGVEKPDLVLTDLNLPGESSLSTVQTLREKFPQTPLVVFSGFINQEIEKRAFELGVKDVLSKTSTNLDISGRISKILQSFSHLKQTPAQSTTGQKTKNSTSTSSSGEKILVVDDDPSIRTLLSEFLTGKNFQVLEAENGEKAIEIVKNENPALVLLDVSMPGMNGLETLRKIREFNSEIGVVMATANEDENTAKEAAALGSYQYVIKPFDLKYLELVVLTRMFMA